MVPANLTAIMLAIRSGYQVSRSLRLRRASSAYGQRTFAGAPLNATKMTISAWAKRGALSSRMVLLAGYNGSSANASEFYFGSDDSLSIDFGGASALSKSSTAKLRDPTAFYHVMCTIDTTLATAADRVKFFINGTQLASYGTDAPPGQNSTHQFIIGGSNNRVGSNWNSSGDFFDGYLAGVHVIDGQAISPDSFGESDTGNWRPKQYTGTYGTNGFRLEFSDLTSLTTLMADSSGADNNWTANNISLTAGVNYDSMLDVPLGGGGNERGNYATWNPLDSAVSKPTNGNLRVGANAGEASRGTIFQSSGKWYFEFQLAVLTAGAAIGIGKSSAARSQYPGFDAAGYGYNPNTGNKTNAGASVAYGATFGTSDIIGIAYDLDSGKIWWSNNGVWQASGDPAAGTNPAFTGVTGEFAPMFGIDSGGAGNGGHANFGQSPFSYTPPAGFKALHTGNLTSGTVTASGSFTGNVSADGPVIWCNGTPETLTINGNAVTWGTHADKTAGGFKLRTASASYNSSGTNNWTATYLSPASNSAFKYQLAKAN